MKSIVIVVNAVNNLLIDELSGDLVEARVVPRREQLLPVEQSPTVSRFYFALSTHQLLALSNGVHHVIQTTA